MPTNFIETLNARQKQVIIVYLAILTFLKNSDSNSYYIEGLISWLQNENVDIPDLESLNLEFDNQKKAADIINCHVMLAAMEQNNIPLEFLEKFLKKVKKLETARNTKHVLDAIENLFKLSEPETFFHLVHASKSLDTEKLKTSCMSINPSLYKALQDGIVSRHQRITKIYTTVKETDEQSMSKTIPIIKNFGAMLLILFFFHLLRKQNISPHTEKHEIYAITFICSFPLALILNVAVVGRFLLPGTQEIERVLTKRANDKEIEEILQTVKITLFEKTLTIDFKPIVTRKINDENQKEKTEAHADKEHLTQLTSMHYGKATFFSDGKKAKNKLATQEPTTSIVIFKLPKKQPKIHQWKIGKAIHSSNSNFVVEVHDAPNQFMMLPLKIIKDFTKTQSGLFREDTFLATTANIHLAKAKGENGLHQVTDTNLKIHVTWEENEAQTYISNHNIKIIGSNFEIRVWCIQLRDETTKAMLHIPVLVREDKNTHVPSHKEHKVTLSPEFYPLKTYNSLTKNNSKEEVIEDTSSTTIVSIKPNH